MFNMDGFTQGFGSGEVKMDLQKKVEEIVLEDIIVVNAGRKNKMTVPEGYEKIDVDLNEKAGGDYIYFCIKKGTDKNKAINGLTIISGKNAKAPKGYEKINQDLNEDAGGKYLYLCKRRGKDNPIHDVKVVSSKSENPPVPQGYKMIMKDLNEGAGGRYIYLCYC